eukprot:gene3498-2534_t
MPHEGRLQYWTSSAGVGTLVDMNGLEYFLHTRVLRECGICERVHDGGKKGVKGKGWVNIVDDAITERRFWEWEAGPSKRGGAPAYSDWEAEMKQINGMDWGGRRKFEPTPLPKAQHKNITWRSENAGKGLRHAKLDDGVQLDQELADYVEPANRRKSKAKTQGVRAGDNIIA